jgi:4-hydroxy-3-polyprenylbenzoate decarboxylase
VAYYDFREYLEKLAGEQELHAISTEVDPHLEIGAIMRRLAERGGPAAHFQNVKGAAAGLSYVGGSMSRGADGIWSRLALTLQLDPQVRYQDLLEDAHRRWETPIRPIEVSGGPCKEVTVKGNKVNLDGLAAPLMHEGAGGACPTSWGVTVVQEPGKGFLAWDILPLQVTSNKTLAGAIPRDSNIRYVMERAAAAGEPLPFAIILGAAPVVPLAAAFRLRRVGAVAPEIAGALQREPLQMVNCETSDLLVPATAEMIIEGVIKPTAEVDVGPFPGPSGYSNSHDQTGVEFEVTAITHRENPILPVCSWGTPISDLHIARGLDSDIQLKAEFEKRGAPVAGVFTPPWLSGSVVAVTTMVPYPAYAQAIAGAVRVVPATKYAPYVLVCDNDIEITNPVALFHALVTKCHPARDTWIIRSSAAAEDAAYVSAGERDNGLGASAIFDCTWPLDWDKSIAVPPKVSFDQCYPKGLQEKVLQEWVEVLNFPPEAERPA